LDSDHTPRIGQDIEKGVDPTNMVKQEKDEGPKRVTWDGKFC